MLSSGWKNFNVIASGDGEKLERWGDYTLLRPDPQVIWHWQKEFPTPNAHYIRSQTGGGKWEYNTNIPAKWTVTWENLSFWVKPMGFKHTGLFPEQSVNWKQMMELIKNANRPISVLNLFAYTGGATVACASAGASVCHVDAAKNMVERAGENMALNNLSDKPVRYIVDDCKKFVQREINRKHKYDAIIMDPPSYGRGSSGELWKIENDIADFLSLCCGVLAEKPLFVLINSYTTGLQPMVLANLLKTNLAGVKGKITAYEVGLPSQDGIDIPCGASGLFVGE